MKASSILSEMAVALLLTAVPVSCAQSGQGGKEQARAQADTVTYVSMRPAPQDRLFTSPSIEKAILDVQSQLTNKRLAWMFGNCFPNTLDTTVQFTEDDGEGHPDTFVITGDIHAMWLRDSGAQVWPYLRFANEDPKLKA